MTDRRGFLGRALAGASTLLLGGCYDLSQAPWFVGALGKVEDLTHSAQSLFAGPQTLAPEFTKADIAPVFRANGTLDPGTPEYAGHVSSGFKNWRVSVTGLVAHPLSLSRAGAASANGPGRSFPASWRRRHQSPRRAMPCFIAPIP